TPKTNPLCNGSDGKPRSSLTFRGTPTYGCSSLAFMFNLRHITGSTSNAVANEATREASGA
ncbi:MAG: hypothetical protein VB878_15840, partial [Pirellulaceae bacterium]